MLCLGVQRVTALAVLRLATLSPQVGMMQEVLLALADAVIVEIGEAGGAVVRGRRNRRGAAHTRLVDLLSGKSPSPYARCVCICVYVLQ